MTSKEALEIIKNTKTNIVKYSEITPPLKLYSIKEFRKTEIKTIQKDLERLETLEIKYKDIKNSHIQECKYTIEVLEENEKLKQQVKDLENNQETVLTTLEISVQQNEKLRKVIKILKNKRVCLDTFMNCKSLDEYNNAMEYTYKSISENYKLTQQEYELLKEVLSNENRTKNIKRL